MQCMQARQKRCARVVIERSAWVRSPSVVYAFSFSSSSSSGREMYGECAWERGAGFFTRIYTACDTGEARGGELCVYVCLDFDELTRARESRV